MPGYGEGVRSVEVDCVGETQPTGRDRGGATAKLNPAVVLASTQPLERIVRRCTAQAGRGGGRSSTTMPVAFRNAYHTPFRGRIEKLQRDYFTFLYSMFFSPFICALRRQAALEGRDVIRFPRVGIIYGKANSGKTQLVEIAERFMFGDEFQGAIRSRLTTQHLRAIEASYRRMPAFFDDAGWRRFRDPATEYIKDETLPTLYETPCTVVSMDARAGSFPDGLAKRCLLIYNSASLPSDDESGRIAMSDRLSAIEPTTHLYRRYVHEVLGRLDADAGAVDWLELSSRIVSELLGGAGHHPEWGEPLA